MEKRKKKITVESMNLRVGDISESPIRIREKWVQMHLELLRKSLIFIYYKNNKLILLIYILSMSFFYCKKKLCCVFSKHVYFYHVAINILCKTKIYNLTLFKFLFIFKFHFLLTYLKVNYMNIGIDLYPYNYQPLNVVIQNSSHLLHRMIVSSSMSYLKRESG